MSSAVHPAVSELCRALLPEVDDIAAAMAVRIRERIPLYAEGEVVTPDELVVTTRDNVTYILGQLAGEDVGADAPRLTGGRRALQGVPFASVLQAFRVGSRFLWELLVERADPEVRDVLLLAASDIWAVSDDLAAEVTEAYRVALADQARRDAQRRAVLVSRLLDGEGPAAEDLSDGSESLSLGRGGELVVVSAECLSPGTEALPGAEAALRRHNVASAWRLDTEHHEGLVRLPVGFGPERLMETVAAIARGRVGISAPFTRMQATAEARSEARMAAAALTPGTTGVLAFADNPLAVLLAGAPESTRSLVLRVLGPVLDLPHDDCLVVLDTARTWLQAAGSTSTAAKQLHLHRNTVRYRLRRLEELTGHDLGHPVQAAELYCALEGVRIFDLARPSRD